MTITATSAAGLTRDEYHERLRLEDVDAWQDYARAVHRHAPAPACREAFDRAMSALLRLSAFEMAEKARGAS